MELFHIPHIPVKWHQGFIYVRHRKLVLKKSPRLRRKEIYCHLVGAKEKDVQPDCKRKRKLEEKNILIEANELQSQKKLWLCFDSLISSGYLCCMLFLVPCTVILVKIVICTEAAEVNIQMNVSWCCAHPDQRDINDVTRCWSLVGWRSYKKTPSKKKKA